MEDLKVEDLKMEELKREDEKKEVVRRKILYLDDVLLSLTMVKEKLKHHYEVYIVQTVAKMFETLENVEVELILLDVNMPDVDGYEVIKKLKVDNKCAKIPIILLTSVTNKDDIVRGMELGAVGYVSKPVSHADLMKAVEYELDPETKKDTKPIILAVDDDPSILQTVNHLLNKDYSIYTMPGVKNKKMLKELLRRIKPDLFLLDCHMPDLSGYELVPIIRETAPHANTPIVFLTADGTIDNLNAAVKTEASDFIVKPINKKILQERMALQLKNFMMWRQIRSVDA